MDSNDARSLSLIQVPRPLPESSTELEAVVRIDQIVNRFSQLLPEPEKSLFVTEMGWVKSEVVQHYFDPVTGLLNRRAVWGQLLKVVGFSRMPGVGVVFTDIDDFKKFNSKYGQAGGDKVLNTMGQILRQQARGADIVGRFGDRADECMVIMQSASSPKAFRKGAIRLIAALNDPEVQAKAGYKFEVPLHVSGGGIWIEWPEHMDRRFDAERYSQEIYERSSQIMDNGKQARKRAHALKLEGEELRFAFGIPIQHLTIHAKQVSEGPHMVLPLPQK